MTEALRDVAWGAGLLSGWVGVSGVFVARCEGKAIGKFGYTIPPEAVKIFWGFNGEKSDVA
ncbi:hypothetical protein GCM10007866_20340 [Gluconobacter albidus]|uniref:Uncharacterized protein n=1 Tax=Gluconobacter albidus TaxID=318683 RepID=A0ABQ5X175_9PROT|nr:hypothetical protein GCM10007866_20340 [Gluconobacter albidus]